MRRIGYEHIMCTTQINYNLRECVGLDVGNLVGWKDIDGLSLGWKLGDKLILGVAVGLKVLVVPMTDALSKASDKPSTFDFSAPFLIPLETSTNTLGSAKSL